MTSSELRDYATVLAALVALMVFMLNVVSQMRNRRIENITRFNQVHQRLFEDNGYLARNLTAMATETLHRDPGNADMERKFHLMLLDIERLAVLANNRAIPRQTQVYLFGFYAPRILSVLTPEERGSMYWELALGYLERLAADATRYGELSREQREAFWH